jgi:hypothetical protein
VSPIGSASADAANRVIGRFSTLDAAAVNQLAKAADAYGLDLQRQRVSLPQLFLSVRQMVPEWPVFDLRLRPARESVRASLADSQFDASERDQIELDAGMAAAYAVLAALGLRRTQLAMRASRDHARAI